jgi:predicted transcriptional regulator
VNIRRVIVDKSYNYIPSVRPIKKYACVLRILADSDRGKWMKFREIYVRVPYSERLACGILSNLKRMGLVKAKLTFVSAKGLDSRYMITEKGRRVLCSIEEVVSLFEVREDEQDDD